VEDEEKVKINKKIYKKRKVEVVLNSNNDD